MGSDKNSESTLTPNSLSLIAIFENTTAPYIDMDFMISTTALPLVTEDTIMGLSPLYIFLIALGCAVFLGLVVITVVCCVKKHKLAKRVRLDLDGGGTIIHTPIMKNNERTVHI
jgi:hypothetical protein